MQIRAAVLHGVISVTIHAPGTRLTKTAQTGCAIFKSGSGAILGILCTVHPSPAHVCDYGESGTKDTHTLWICWRAPAPIFSIELHKYPSSSTCLCQGVHFSLDRHTEQKNHSVLGVRGISWDFKLSLSASHVVLITPPRSDFKTNNLTCGFSIFQLLKPDKHLSKLSFDFIEICFI